MEPKWYTETDRTWGDLFNEVAERFPGKEALVFRGERLTYRDLRRRIDTCAKGLMKIGVKGGDHVALWMTNSPEWIYVQFAVYKLGAALLPVYTRFKQSELEYSLKQSDSSTLIMNDQFLGKIDAMEMFKSLCPEVDQCRPGELSAERLPRLKRVICFSDAEYTGMFPFSKIMESGEDPSLDEALVPGALVFEEPLADIDPLRDIRRLLANAGHHRAGLPVKAHFGRMVSDLTDSVSGDIGNIDITIGCNFTGDKRQPCCDQRLAGDPAIFILFNNRIEYGI